MKKYIVKTTYSFTEELQQYKEEQIENKQLTPAEFTEQEEEIEKEWIEKATYDNITNDDGWNITEEKAWIEHQTGGDFWVYRIITEEDLQEAKKWANHRGDHIYEKIKKGTYSIDFKNVNFDHHDGNGDPLQYDYLLTAVDENGEMHITIEKHTGSFTSETIQDYSVSLSDDDFEEMNNLVLKHGKEVQ